MTKGVLVAGRAEKELGETRENHPQFGSGTLAKMTETRQAANIVFRFADEDDAQDIQTLVQSAYVVEEGSEGTAFYQKIPILEIEQIEQEIKDVDGKVWYLAETADVAMDLVGVACFSINGSTGIIHKLAIDPVCQKQGHGIYLAAAVESVLKHRGCQVVEFTTSHWRTDVIQVAQARGYVECAGGIWEDNTNLLSRPSRYVTLRKPLGNTPPQKLDPIGDMLRDALTGFEGMEITPMNSSPVENTNNPTNLSEIDTIDTCCNKLQAIEEALRTAVVDPEPCRQDAELEDLVRLLATQIRSEAL